MSKNSFFPVLICSVVFFAFMNSASFALQSGGIEIGDSRTGSIRGSLTFPFYKFLEADFTLTALCVGGQKSWYPPILVLDLRDQGPDAGASQPVLLEVKNPLPIPQGFSISTNSPFVGPTSMDVNVTIRPGETKYISVATSSLLFVRNGAVLATYKSKMDPDMPGGKLVILR